MYQSKKILVLVLIFSLFSAWGQVKFNAPYSSEGIGEINNTGLTFNQGMSGLGVATSSVQFINLKNPALLTRTRYTAMEFGFQGTTRLLQEGTNSQTNTDFTLANISLAFPIAKTWTSAIGITPYSTVNYQTETEVALSDGNTSALQKNVGSGGITKFYFSNGKQVLNDSVHKIQLYLGLELGYLFGLVDKRNEVQLRQDGSLLGYYTQQTNKTHYSDFVFRPAFSLRKEIKMRKEKERKTVQHERNRPYYENDTLAIADYQNMERVIISNGEIKTEPSNKQIKGKYKLYLKEEHHYKGQVTRTYEAIPYNKYLTAKRIQVLQDTLVTVEKLFKSDSLNQGSGVYSTIGFVYEHTSKFNTSQLLAIERYSTSGLLLSSDTINNTSPAVTMPGQIQLGISFDKPLPKGMDESGQLKEKVWSIGADLSYTQWSQYEDAFGNKPFKDSYKITVGGEYVPRILSNRFFKRTIYRTGFYYGTLPNQLTENVNDFGISFGMSMPMGPFNAKKLPRYINLAFNYGQRGDFNNKLIKEHYFATSISFTVNNKWFQRYKVGL